MVLAASGAVLSFLTTNPQNIRYFAKKFTSQASKNAINYITQSAYNPYRTKNEERTFGSIKYFCLDKYESGYNFIYTILQKNYYKKFPDNILLFVQWQAVSTEDVDNPDTTYRPIYAIIQNPNTESLNIQRKLFYKRNDTKKLNEVMSKLMQSQYAFYASSQNRLISALDEYYKTNIIFLATLFIVFSILLNGLYQKFSKIGEKIMLFIRIIRKYLVKLWNVLLVAAKNIKKNLFAILTWLTLTLGVLSILPYVLEIYYNVHYRPTLTVNLQPLRITEDKDGDWLADYNISIEGNQYLTLPKKIIVSYDDHTIVPNEHPNMPGGTLGSLPIPNAKSLALIWDCQNSVIHSNRSLGFLTRARLKEKRDIVPIQLMIYAEIDPYDLGFWRLFYHSRVYKGFIKYSLDFTKEIGQDVIVTLK